LRSARGPGQTRRRPAAAASARGWWWAGGGGGGGGEGRCNGLSSDVWHRYKRRGASSSSERLVVTHYICIYSCTDAAAAAAVLYIYSWCVCVQCAREHYTGVVGIGCSFHISSKTTRASLWEVIAGEREREREWASRGRIDGEKPPGGTPSPQQCVIRRPTPSPIYRGKRMYDLYYIYSTHIYIYVRVVCVCVLYYVPRTHTIIGICIF